MGALVSCIATSATWCFCSALGSLFGACCGNDKPGNVAPSAFSGRKRSVFLLVIAVAIAVGFQYGIAEIIYRLGPSANYVTEAWWKGCEEYDTGALQLRCIGNQGVYRSGFSAVSFFSLAAIAVCLSKTANRVAWPAKYVLFVFLAIGMAFVPNDPLFSHIFLNVARIGAILFIVIEQIIFVDLAHNWNDGWVLKADTAENEEAGSGKKWLMAIVSSAVFLFVASIVGWVLLFHFYGNCDTNIAFIAITVAFSILITLAQLSGVEGSLLASSIITAYATSLCYTAVSRNPEKECNPFLGKKDALGIVIGLTLTFVSLAYTGWSRTADNAMSTSKSQPEEAAAKEITSKPDYGSTKVLGIVTNDEENEDDGDNENPEDVPDTFSNNWKLNLALVAISCWFSMILTGWGSIEAEGDAANPQVGKISVWVIIGSQWLVLALYLWTLVAPRLFPDRDFS